jgi:hypothetical protein
MLYLLALDIQILPRMIRTGDGEKKEDGTI